MEGYTSRVIDSSRELSAKEKVMLKDISDATQLDSVSDGNGIVIHPAYYAVVAIHNEKSDNKDYNKYVIVDEKGEKYVTGSEAFWSTFKDIMADMKDADEEWELKIYKLPSKNYSGRGFITCSVI